MAEPVTAEQRSRMGLTGCLLVAAGFLGLVYLVASYSWRLALAGVAITWIICGLVLGIASVPDVPDEKTK